MGLDNRHYVRGGGQWRPNVVNPRGRRHRGGFRDWEVWKQIIAINVAVFLLQIFITRPVSESDLRSIPFQDDSIADAEYMDDMDDMDEFESFEFDESDNATDASETDKTIAEDAITEVAISSEADAQQELQAAERAERRQRQLLRQIQSMTPRVSVVQDWFELDTQKVLEGQVWRLITAGFCHDRGSLFHLLFNMLFLFWFGNRLESQFGSREFIAFYFTGLIFSSLTYLVVDWVTGTNIPAIGASGAVWSVIAVYALLYPYERIYVYFLFPVEIRFLVLIYFVFDLHPLLLMLSGQPSHSGVAHAAHVGGAVFGFLYWYNGWRLMPIYETIKAYFSTFDVQPRPRVSSQRVSSDAATLSSAKSKNLARSDNPSSNDDAEGPRKLALDQILKKISRDGKESLTDEELEVLEKTSRDLRDQRRGK